jgi:hypothetical protein
MRGRPRPLGAVAAAGAGRSATLPGLSSDAPDGGFEGGDEWR